MKRTLILPIQGSFVQEIFPSQGKTFASMFSVLSFLFCFFIFAFQGLSSNCGMKAHFQFPKTFGQTCEPRFFTSLLSHSSGPGNVQHACVPHGLPRALVHERSVSPHQVSEWGQNNFPSSRLHPASAPLLLEITASVFKKMHESVNSSSLWLRIRVCYLQPKHDN